MGLAQREDRLCPVVSLQRPTPRQAVTAQCDEGHDTGALGEVMVRETSFSAWAGPGITREKTVSATKDRKLK